MSNPNIKDYGFKKGRVYNPGGRPKLTGAVAELNKLTREEHVKLVCTLLHKTPNDLVKIKEDPKSTNHEQLIASLLWRAMTKADAFIYDKLMDRVIGKVTLPISTNDGKPFEVKILND
jgi:hypothetical protein